MSRRVQGGTRAEVLDASALLSAAYLDDSDAAELILDSADSRGVARCLALLFAGHLRYEHESAAARILS